MISPRFAEFINEWGVNAIWLRELTSGMYLLFPSQEINLDLSGRGLEYSQRCEMCGRHENALCNLDAPYSFIPGQRPIGPNEMLRTYQTFGSAHEKFLFVVVGDELAQKIEEARLSGVYFNEIEQPKQGAAFRPKREDFDDVQW